MRRKYFVSTVPLINYITKYMAISGECQCTGMNWAGALCDKCADGYTGDMCEREDVTPTTPSLTTRIFRPIPSTPGQCVQRTSSFEDHKQP